MLLERATELEATGHRLIQEFHNHSKGHLIITLTHEVEELEKLTNIIKSTEANVTDRTRTLNELEEQLLYRENRITDELDFALDLYNFNGTGRTQNELIEYGQKLITDAKAILAKHDGHDHNRSERASLQIEINDIEKLIRDIRQHASSNRRVEVDEAQLVKQERTIRALIKEIESAHH